MIDASPEQKAAMKRELDWLQRRLVLSHIERWILVVLESVFWLALLIAAPLIAFPYSSWWIYISIFVWIIFWTFRILPNLYVTVEGNHALIVENPLPSFLFFRNENEKNLNFKNQFELHVGSNVLPSWWKKLGTVNVTNDILIEDDPKSASEKYSTKQVQGSSDRPIVTVDWIMPFRGRKYYLPRFRAHTENGPEKITKFYRGAITGFLTSYIDRLSLDDVLSGVPGFKTEFEKVLGGPEEIHPLEALYGVDTGTPRITDVAPPKTLDELSSFVKEMEIIAEAAAKAKTKWPMLSEEGALQFVMARLGIPMNRYIIQGGGGIVPNPANPNNPNPGGGGGRNRRGGRRGGP